MTHPDRFLNMPAGLPQPGGKLLLSAPVETGPPVVIGQAFRRATVWRKIGDCASALSCPWGEPAEGVGARGERRIPRVVHPDNHGATSHLELGFNWVTQRDRIARHLTLDDISASHIEWLRPSQARRTWLKAHRA